MRGFLLAGGVAGLAVLRFGQAPEWSWCGFLLLTGRPCPFCGMTRALFALAHGNWAAAVELHLLSPLVFALILGLTAAAGFRLLRPGAWPWAGVSYPHWLALAGMFALYGTARIWRGF